VTRYHNLEKHLPSCFQSWHKSFNSLM